MGDKNRPFRLTRGKISAELSLFIMFFIWGWRLFKWGLRRLKPIAYHPIAIIGITLLGLTFAITPWFPLAPVALFSALFVWFIAFLPTSWRRQVQPRLASFFVGFKYRHRPRPKLKANGLLSDDDPVPTVSAVEKIGCTTRVRIKMSYGDSITYWRDGDRPARIAQTYNALDCKINPYRRDKFTSVRLDRLTLSPPFVKIKFQEKVTKARWLQLEFMTKDPFGRAVGFEYIDFHRQADAERDFSLGNPVGPMRDGKPYLLKVDTHLLVVAMSGYGKSNAERAMVYADYPDVLTGRLENWIFDGKRGTEARAMAQCFAKHEYGQDGAVMVTRFFEAAQDVMFRRLDLMGETGETLFTPTPGHWDGDTWVRGDPRLKIYIDEIMILESELYAEEKKKIYRIIQTIQQQGRAAGVSIIAFAQNPKLDRLPLRDDFPEIQIGGLQNRRQIDTAIAGGWDLGAREIPKDMPGVFYIKTEAGMALEQIRYAHDRHNAIKKLPKCPPTAFTLTSEELREQVRTGILIR